MVTISILLQAAMVLVIVQNPVFLYFQIKCYKTCCNLFNFPKNEDITVTFSHADDVSPLSQATGEPDFVESLRKAVKYYGHIERTHFICR